MKTSKKTVQFDQFKPYYIEVDQSSSEQEYLYEFSKLLQHISSHPLSCTNRKILGDTYMFHVCQYDEREEVWEMQILHLREKILPGIADDGGSYELIQLEDNQYPAESTTIIYDPKNYTIYMQRNIYGISIKTTEMYIQMLSPIGTQVLLKPISNGNNIRKVTDDKKYRKIILVADSAMEQDGQRQESLSQIIRAAREYQGRIVKVEIGFGRQRTGYLNAKKAAQLVREAYSYNGTLNLAVRVAENEDTQVETIDLLDDRECFRINIEYSRANPITHSRLYRMCLGERRERA